MSSCGVRPIDGMIAERGTGTEGRGTAEMSERGTTAEGKLPLGTG